MRSLKEPWDGSVVWVFRIANGGRWICSVLTQREIVILWVQIKLIFRSTDKLSFFHTQYRTRMVPITSKILPIGPTRCSETRLAREVLGNPGHLLMSISR